MLTCERSGGITVLHGGLACMPALTEFGVANKWPSVSVRARESARERERLQRDRESERARERAEEIKSSSFKRETTEET